jgi:hypothetical protein
LVGDEENGALLVAAEEAGFDLFITADQELTYQQNLTGRKTAVLVLSTNNWDFVKAGGAIMAAIGTVTPGSDIYRNENSSRALCRRRADDWGRMGHKGELELGHRSQNRACGSSANQKL